MTRKHTKITLILLLTLSLSIVSCTAPKKSTDNDNQISNESYQDAQTNFSELKILFKNKQYNDAYSLLKFMTENLPYSRYTKHGKILEIYSYYEQNKFSTAIKKANKFISSHPLHTQLDYVFYIRAISSFELNKALYQNLSQIPHIIEINRNKVRKTFLYFSELAQKYPKSDYFNEAIQKVKILRQVLAEYEINDAYILYDAAKYEDVIKHLDFMMENFPNSKSIAKALKLEAKAHRMLGNIDTAKSIETNIRRNFSE
ncbi:MAG: outer membrane protein assembly factor BamD [Gammaproteobacteria bacterium]